MVDKILESNFRVCEKCAVISEQQFHDELLHCLGMGEQPYKIEQAAIGAGADVDSV